MNWGLGWNHWNRRLDKIVVDVVVIYDVSDKRLLGLGYHHRLGTYSVVLQWSRNYVFRLDLRSRLRSANVFRSFMYSSEIVMFL